MKPDGRPRYITLPSMLCSLNIAAGPLFNPAIFDVSHPARSMNRSTHNDSNKACRLLERSSGVIGYFAEVGKQQRRQGNIEDNLWQGNPLFRMRSPLALEAAIPIKTRIANIAICLITMPNAIVSFKLFQLVRRFTLYDRRIYNFYS